MPLQRFAWVESDLGSGSLASARAAGDVSSDSFVGFPGSMLFTCQMKLNDIKHSELAHHCTKPCKARHFATTVYLTSFSVFKL